MSATRLSPLDDSFLEAESPTAHMHVGWAAVFDPPSRGPRPDFEQLRRHIESRLARTPRYRQKVSPAPFGLDAPSWIDDEQFDIERHVIRSDTDDLDRLASDCMSRQLEPDRPLWEICIADRLRDGRIGLIGKVHHCMVDGVAAVELALLLLDPTSEPPDEQADDWRAEPPPSRIARLRTSAREKASSQLELAREAARLMTSPRRLSRVPRRAADLVGAFGRGLRPTRPAPTLNEPISTRRRLARVERPLTELQQIKRHFRATVNDVYLAIAAGALRRLQLERDREPRPLKTMVPVNVREDGQLEELGNRISFMFVDLPCDEPNPVRRLRRLQAALARRKRGNDAGTATSVMDLAGHLPRWVQRLTSRVVTSPRMFNLTVSNIPGPTEPMFMLGCELKAAYPVVPIPDRHALSIGMTTIRDRACFGLYADRKVLGDVQRVADAVEDSSDELLALT